MTGSCVSKNQEMWEFELIPQSLHGFDVSCCVGKWERHQVLKATTCLFLHHPPTPPFPLSTKNSSSLGPHFLMSLATRENRKTEQHVSVLCCFSHTTWTAKQNVLSRHPLEPAHKRDFFTL